MKMVKKNILALFYVILFLGFIILQSIIYAVYNNVYDEFKQEQENIVKMTANSITSVFLQYEMILNILGTHLREENKFKNLEQSQILLDDLLRLNPSILGFTLVKPTGDVYLTSTNISSEKIPNLLEKNETKETFQVTLQSKKMIVGRTYFSKQIGKFLIPIRKTIYDKNNKPVAVMTAGIDLNNGFDFFIKNEKNDQIHNTFLFRNSDYFFQIAQKYQLSNPKIYDNPIPKKLVETSFERVVKIYKKSLDEIKNKQIVITTESDDKRDVLSSGIYLNRYDLWLTTQSPLSTVYKKIYLKSAVLILLFFIVMLLIYLLFRYIHNYEKKKQEVLYYQATHDYLTKLGNRLLLSNKFQEKNTVNPYTLFLIDMDNFKNINDNYGHNYGDEILIQISKRLNSFQNNDEVIVRYSGDEFVFISYCIEQEKVENLAKNIIKSLTEPYSIKPYQFNLGASMGISQFPADGNCIQDVLRYSDIAMNEVKNTKNSYCIFDLKVKNKFLKTVFIEEQLKNSIDNNELYMVYQPQVHPNGTLYGVEALVRWENEKLGFVSPDQFIVVAESIGFMEELGKFIVDRSLSDIIDLQNKYNIDFQLSINISVKQFMEENFVKNLFEMIDEYKYKKVSLTLEVTENIFIEDINYILEILNKVKMHGIKISLDDFGTGYSSLSLLKKLPIDELKIDKSFVDDIVLDVDAKVMVESIISIGKNLNMKILAEGVEDLEQKKLLTKYGCDLIQGYYFSKPLSISDLESYLIKSKCDC